MTYYVKGTEPAADVLWGLALGKGKVKWLGDQCGRILNSDGERIGDFHRSLKGGWSVWTKEYAGYASSDEVEIRPCPAGDTCQMAYLHVPVSGNQE